MAGRGAKLTEIVEPGVVVTCIWGTLKLLVFKVILGSSGALVSTWPVTRKWLAVERNKLKFRSRG